MVDDEIMVDDDLIAVAVVNRTDAVDPRVIGSRIPARPVVRPG